MILETLEPRLLLSGEISGLLWTDLDVDGVSDAGAPGLADRTVELADLTIGCDDATVTPAGGSGPFDARPVDDTTPPTVIESIINGGLDIGSRVETFRFTFSEDVRVLADALHLHNVTTGEDFPASMSSFDHLTGTWDYSQVALTDGRYSGTLWHLKVSDLAFNRLDGDNDGVAGGEYSFPFSVLLGDINGDLVVDSDDADGFEAQFGMSGDSLASDFDSDGSVGLSDFAVLRSKFGVRFDGVDDTLDVQLRVVDNPHAADRMSDASFESYDSLSNTEAGSVFYAEVWLRDLGTGRGVTSGTVDIAYSTDHADAVAINHGGLYTVFASGSIHESEGLIDNLGGATLTIEEGTTQWVRLGWVEMLSTGSGESAFSIGHDLLQESVGVVNPQFETMPVMADSFAVVEYENPYGRYPLDTIGEGNCYKSRRGRDPKGAYTEFLMQDSEGTGGQYAVMDFNGWVDVDGGCRIYDEGLIHVWRNIVSETTGSVPDWSGAFGVGYPDRINTCSVMNNIRYDGEPSLEGNGRMQDARGKSYLFPGWGEPQVEWLAVHLSEYPISVTVNPAAAPTAFQSPSPGLFTAVNQSSESEPEDTSFAQTAPASQANWPFVDIESPFVSDQQPSEYHSSTAQPPVERVFFGVLAGETSGASFGSDELLADLLAESVGAPL